MELVEGPARVHLRHGVPGLSGSHWFEEIADHLGPAYLRYSFTKGTANEVDFLVDALGLTAGQRLLDVGCGPGRHAHALGARGIEVVGVDISATFIDLARQDAPPGVSFQRLDARALPFDAEFDAAISLCQGAFGLLGPTGDRDGDGDGDEGGTALDPDGAVLEGMARALRPGGVLGASAFSSYFQVRFLEETDAFDAASGVNHERTTLKDPDGNEIERDLWTTCFTPRELRLLARSAGLEPAAVWSVTPGRYGRRPPNLDEPELFLLATRPAA